MDGVEAIDGWSVMRMWRLYKNRIGRKFEVLLMMDMYMLTRSQSAKFLLS